MRTLEEIVEEKQRYITNLEAQLKLAQEETEKTKEYMEEMRQHTHQLEIKLLNSSEEKISEIKSGYEAKIRTVWL